MNQCHISDNDDSRFDRLVDGELNDTERHQLLASLDDEPGGWRSCALAFLEAQAWRGTMRDVQRCEGAVTGNDDGLGAPESQLLKSAKPTTSVSYCFGAATIICRVMTSMVRS